MVIIMEFWERINFMSFMNGKNESHGRIKGSNLITQQIATINKGEKKDQIIKTTRKKLLELAQPSNHSCRHKCP